MMVSEQEDKVAASRATVKRGHMLVSEAAARAAFTLGSLANVGWFEQKDKELDTRATIAGCRAFLQCPVLCKVQCPSTRVCP